MKKHNFFKQTFIYKIYNIIKEKINFYKAKKFIGETFYSEEFKYVIEKYLKCKLRKDWLGRLYGITNPALNNNGKFDISTMIIEFNDEQTNNTEWANQWIFKQMIMIGELFKIEKMYDYISLEIKHVGPPNQDNYLIIFDLINRKQYAKALKSFLITLFIYVGIILVCFLYFKN